MQATVAQTRAAGQMVDLVVARLGTGRAVHSETAVASVARLAGSLLLRSFRVELRSLPPGTAILLDEADEQTPYLQGTLLAMLRRYGVPISSTPVEPTLADRGDPPELTVVESLARLQDDALLIARSNGLGQKDAAWSAAIATAFVVKECARDLGTDVAVAIASRGFTEGAKTVPPALRPQAGTPPALRKKPWYKFWRVSARRLPAGAAGKPRREDR